MAGHLNDRVESFLRLELNEQNDYNSGPTLILTAPNWPPLATFSQVTEEMDTFPDLLSIFTFVFKRNAQQWWHMAFVKANYSLDHTNALQ